jgi:hypothetical protein
MSTKKESLDCDIRKCESGNEHRKVKKVKKHKLKAQSNDTEKTFHQCLSCGVLIDNVGCCGGSSCEFDAPKRSNSISYTGT